MRFLSLISVVFLTGCVCLNPDHKKGTPPSVNTAEVINSLETTKTSLDDAGISNAKVDAKLDRAITLAEKLDEVIRQIEQEQAIINLTNNITTTNIVVNPQ